MTQVFEPVVDEVLDTPELPEIMTTTNSPVAGESIPDAMRRKFVESLKPSPYVIRCSEKDDEFFHSIYPPLLAECKQLPGQGKPGWLYEMNYCIDCHSSLESCKTNPYGFHGEIGKARREAQEQHRIKALIAKQAEQSVLPKKATSEHQDGDDVSGSGDTSEVAVSAGPRRRGRQPLPGIAREISEDQKPLVQAAYLEFKTLAQVSEEFKINLGVVRDYLAAEGVLRAKGSHLKAGSPNAPTIIRRGKPRSTVEVTPELVKKAMKLFTKGKMGMVAIAKDMNCNPAELSTAMKAAGAVIQRGKKKAA